MNEDIIKILLRDQTTERNIIWANGSEPLKEIQPSDVDSIKPRWQKLRAHQKQRTRDRAEIFTPPEVCKLQNDLMEETWLRSIAVPWLKAEENLDEAAPTDKAIIESDFQKIAAVFFNREPAPPIDTIVAKWLAEYETLWQGYVDAKFLEVTCGEAPYLVSRYNAVTGETIPLDERIGLLDRKLRLVSKHTANESDWIKWAGVALCSVYGYEFQGDNLFLARRNVFETFKDYYRQRFAKEPPDDILRAVAEIISYNLWQMDGKTNAIPYYEPPPKKPKSKENPNQMSLFETEPPREPEPEKVYCKILDWRTGEVEPFKDLVEGGGR